MKNYPEVVVGVYIFNAKDEILLTRGPKWGKYWMIPAGHVEYGEEVFDAVKREAMEEVGLKVKPLGVLMIGQDIFPKNYHKKRHFIYIETICKALSTMVKADDREVKEYRWMDKNAVIKDVKHTLLRKVILGYLKQKKKGKVDYIDMDFESAE